MPKKVLIIEDDEPMGRALQALCEKLGLEASISRNGKEGLEAACQKGPDLILLDMLVPGLDGFKVAEGLKNAKSRSALIVVTGVYKDPKVAKEFADKYGADFFVKPFKVDDLVGCISRRTGLAAPEKPAPPPAPKRASVETAVVGPMEGTLEQKPFHALLMELSRNKASGTLDLTQGQVKKRIFMYCGQVRYAQSNLKSENVGGMQVAEGALTEETFRAAVARAREERIGIGEALAVSGAMTYDVLEKAIRRQVEEVCVNAFAWTEGRYVFVPGPTDKIQDARHDPLALLFAAYKRLVPVDRARAQLSALHKGTISRGPDFDRSLFTLRAVFVGETVTPMVNGRLTVGEVVAKARPDDLPLLAALVQLKLTMVVGAEAEKKVAPVQTAAPDRPYTPEEEAARSEILPEYERVLAAPNLFAVLRLQRGASIEEVKASYHTLAKRFHTDSFAGLELGEGADQLTEMFGRIAEAHSILSEPKRRADYEALLERLDAGLPTDMEIIFKAEATFNRGDALIKQGRFAEAEGILKEALKLDPSVAQYHVALAQALMKGRGAAGLVEAHEILDKALALNPEHFAAKLLLAQVVEQEGSPKGALKLIDEALGADPTNAEAGRLYRAVRDRMKASKSKGLFDKLFKR